MKNIQKMNVMNKNKTYMIFVIYYYLFFKFKYILINISYFGFKIEGKIVDLTRKIAFFFWTV